MKVRKRLLGQIKVPERQERLAESLCPSLLWVVTTHWIFRWLTVSSLNAVFVLLVFCYHFLSTFF